MKTLKVGKTHILVVDTESNTTTGALTSVQIAPVYKYSNPYPIEYSDAHIFKCSTTKEGMELLHNYLISNFRKGANIILYCHNLKWDITFWLNWLIKDLHYHHRIEHRTGKIILDKRIYTKRNFLLENEFDSLITQMGQVFTLKYNYNDLSITIQDSLKIIPFKLEEAGESYNTKFKKIKGEDYDGILSDKYCLHDVLCLSELVSIQINEGIDPRYTLSLASWCLKDYKEKLFESKLGDEYLNHLKSLYKDESEIKKRYNASRCYRYYFPQLDELSYFPTDTKDYKTASLDSYIRRAYRGGLTYCNPNAQDIIFISRWFYEKYKDSNLLKDIMASGNYKIVNNISHLDVHSLYPSKCLKGYRNYNTLPIGKPVLRKGAPTSKEVEDFLNNKCHFAIRFKCKFNIIQNRFPSVQIKGSYFNSNDWLTTSKITIDGKEYDNSVIMTLTDVEFVDFINRYELKDVVFIDYMLFKKVEKCEYLFDFYMGYYYKMKSETSKSDFVKYQSIKSKLNNLTGKYGTNTIAGTKIPTVASDGSIQLINRKTGENGEILVKNSEYTPIIAWITAYGRLTLLDEMDRAGTSYTDKIYITGDTDSLFVASDERFIPSLGITKNELNTFDEEHSPEDIAMFCASRQKTYILIDKDLKVTLKVAGMTEEQKKRFIKLNKNPILAFSKQELNVKGGKLIKKATPEGAVLVDTDFSLTERTSRVSLSRFENTVDRQLKNESPSNFDEFIKKMMWDKDYKAFVRKKKKELIDNFEYSDENFKKALGVDFNIEYLV